MTILKIFINLDINLKKCLIRNLQSCLYTGMKCTENHYPCQGT